MEWNQCRPKTVKAQRRKKKEANANVRQIEVCIVQGRFHLRIILTPQLSQEPLLWYMPNPKHDDDYWLFIGARLTKGKKRKKKKTNPKHDWKLGLTQYSGTLLISPRQRLWICFELCFIQTKTVALNEALTVCNMWKRIRDITYGPNSYFKIGFVFSGFTHLTRLQVVANWRTID